MINKLLYLLNRPEKGWDPVPTEYAQKYSEYEYDNINDSDFKKIMDFYCDINNKTLIDLGGGPGQYSVAFAKHGALVTWHDISRNYLNLLKHKNVEEFNINYSIGYLEEAKGHFQFLFNRICWCYCMNDKKFAKIIYDLLEENGKAYIVTNNEYFLKNTLKKNLSGIIRLLQFKINSIFNIKIGHPHPEHNKLKKIFKRLKLKYIDIGIENNNTVIKLIK